MLQKLTLFHPYISDRAAISASSEVSGMNASNLLRSSQPTDVWRATELSGLTLDIHLPENGGISQDPWTTIAPLYTNSGPNDTWRISLAYAQADLGTGGASLDTGFIPVRPCPNMDDPGEPEWRHALWRSLDLDGVTPLERDEQWIRIYYNAVDPLMPSGYVGAQFVQWGRLYVARGWRPSYHRDKGMGLTPAAETPRKAVSQGGQSRFGRASRARKFRFNVGFVGKEEMLTEGYRLDRMVGASGDLLAIDDPADPVHMHKLMIYGTIEPGEIRHEDYEIWSRSYSLTEML